MFAATGFAVLRAGARPVFADVDRETFALLPATVDAALTPSTKAVVLVQITIRSRPTCTHCVNCATSVASLSSKTLRMCGAAAAGTFAGSFGVAGPFSFYPTNVITSGEGGMIVTADERTRDEAVIYRDQGKAGFRATCTSARAMPGR